MTNKKLSEEEVQGVQVIQRRKQAVVVELGQLELDKMELEARRTSILAFRDETVQGEQGLVKELEDKYGIGSIDLEKGEFIPAPVPKKPRKKKA